MLKSKDVLKMEQELMQSLSPGFFEHDTHDPTELIIYETFRSVKNLRERLEGREKAVCLTCRKRRGCREDAENCADANKREEGQADEQTGIHPQDY